jgi:hypothetical protein
MGMIDTTKVLQQYLTASGSLLTFLGGSYVSSPIAPRQWNNEHKTIIFHAETEDRHIAADVNSTIFVCKCYGGSASFEAARAVYIALVDYLHNARDVAVDEGRIKLARLITAFQGPADPDTGWPSMIAKFEVITEAAL